MAHAKRKVVARLPISTLLTTGDAGSEDAGTRAFLSARQQRAWRLALLSRALPCRNRLTFQSPGAPLTKNAPKQPPNRRLQDTAYQTVEPKLQTRENAIEAPSP